MFIMKRLHFGYSWVCLLALAASLGACSEENEPGEGNGEDGDNSTVVEAASIDYNEKNAASWGNYMTQVSGLLKNDAADLYNAWAVSYSGGESFAAQFKAHTGGDYSSALSCVEQIIDGCTDIANEVGTAKIGDPYSLWNQGDKEKALYAVESWYSWHSREDYSNNIVSILNSYNGTLDGTVSPRSISALVRETDPALEQKVRGAINAAREAILNIPAPFRNNISSSESAASMEACADLEETLANDLKNAVRTAGEARLQEIVDNYVDVVVLPTYLELKNLNSALHDAVTSFRNAPSDANFAAACEAWLKARAPWEKSEAFLFGPVDALGLDPNMDSWPLDQDAIVQILNSGNYDLDWSDGDSDDKIEAQQSVRGFHTLEFLLFKDGKPRTTK